MKKDTPFFSVSFSEGVIILLTIALFFAGSILSSHYETQMRAAMLIDGGFGYLTFVLITAISIVIAPIGSIFLIPIAVHVWGPFLTALLSIIGWTIGSVAAFVISRKYGKSIVGKFVSLEKLEKMEHAMPKSHLFLSVILLRMVLPVDVLSYAIGLFSTMRLKQFLLATIVGVAPFGFFISYAVTKTIVYQLAAFGVFGLFTLIGITIVGKK